MKNTLLHDNFRLSAAGFLRAFAVYLFLLLFFAIIRLVALFFFNGSPEVFSETGDLLKAFFTGFKFDTMVVFYGLFPVIILNIAGIFTAKHGEKYFSILSKFSCGYYTALGVLILLVSVIDLYYFNFFQTRLDVRLYGFLEDDTLAVVQTIWKDYPVLLIMAGLIAGGVGAYKLAKLSRRILLPDFKLPLMGYWAGLTILMFLFVIGLRGNLSASPIRNTNTYISKYLFINQLVPNGVYALKTALKERRNLYASTDTDKAMAKWGFASPSEAVSAYLGRTVEGDAESLKKEMTDYTPVDTFLEENPPNVVFILMEGMSAHFLELHDRENFNLLGKLEDVLPECIHFTRFLPASNGTIFSLEGILVNNPMGPLCESPYMEKSLTTSVAMPFKEKGYRTSFVTGGSLDWRSLGLFMPRQYIDNIEGSEHLEEIFPQARANSWGCFDEFMFTRIRDLLEQSGDEPQFVFGLTVTNHSPHTLPETYKPHPVNMPGKIKHGLAAKKDLINWRFLTYQYANEFLGRFIDTIRNSPLGENTIIVATGDHVVRRVLEYPDSDMLHRHAVPLIMYIPEKYRQRVEMPDTKAFASHKDIFPTIFNLSLSNAAYVRSGINLFDKDALAGNFAISEYNVVMNGQGCVLGGDENVYYTWADEEKTILKPADEDEARQLEDIALRGRGYSASMTYLIHEELLKRTVE